jgi:hypothetical protein
VRSKYSSCFYGNHSRLEKSPKLLGRNTLNLSPHGTDIERIALIEEELEAVIEVLNPSVRRRKL